MSSFSRVIVVATLAGLLFAVVGCNDDDNPTEPTPPAVDPKVLSMIRTDWRLASMPYQLKASESEWTRGTMRWHNPPAIWRPEVYQDEDPNSNAGLVPLRLIFRPHGFKYTGGSDDPCSDSALAKSWGGIMMPFDPQITTGSPLLFEMRAKGGRGILHFDFGQISDDIDGDGIRDDEDREPYNDWLEEGEDTGLDQKMDSAETDICGSAFNATSNPDPASDNWWFEGEGKGTGSDNHPPVPLGLWNVSGYRAAVEDEGNWRHYEWINGTEGNSNDATVQAVPDREAPGGYFDEYNHYFSLTIALDTLNSPYLVAGSGRNGWFTYRVALCACPGIVDTIFDGYGAASLTWADVEQARVWFEQDTTGVDSLESMDSVWIAHWKLITED